MLTIRRMQAWLLVQAFLGRVQETSVNLFLVENPVGAVSWNQLSRAETSNYSFVAENISNLCMFGSQGSTNWKSTEEACSHELLKLVVRMCRNKHVHGQVKALTNTYRSSSQWHTRAWAQAAIRGVENDATQRFEAFPAKDVAMEAPGPAVLDDEFLAELGLDKPRFRKEFPMK